jgi:lipid A oxidase
MHTLRLVVFTAVALLPMAANAEFQISGYGGVNTANNSDVTLKTPLVSGTYDVDWYGDSFHMPPYWGVRGTWWLTNFNRPRWGVAIDYTHAKVKASDLGVIPFSHLEFTDGLNTITLNGLYRMPLNDRFTAYVGAGAGAAFPHVEVKTIPYQGTTWEYQLTGPDFQGLLGVNVDVAYGVSLFAEYKANYSINDADLVGGGSLKTNVLTHNFSLGVSFSLGPRPQY